MLCRRPPSRSLCSTRSRPRCHYLHCHRRHRPDRDHHPRVSPAGRVGMEGNAEWLCWLSARRSHLQHRRGEKCLNNIVRMNWQNLAIKINRAEISH